MTPSLCLPSSEVRPLPCQETITRPFPPGAIGPFAEEQSLEFSFQRIKGTVFYARVFLLKGD